MFLPAAVGNVVRQGGRACQQGPTVESEGEQAVIRYPPLKVGGFCCPVPPGPRFPKLVRQREPNGYRWHFQNGPITVVPYRAKTKPLLRASILFRPLKPPHRIAAEETGGGAGYCPRVRYAYVAGRLSP